MCSELRASGRALPGRVRRSYTEGKRSTHGEESTSCTYYERIAGFNCRGVNANVTPHVLCVLCVLCAVCCVLYAVSCEL